MQQSSETIKQSLKLFKMQPIKNVNFSQHLSNINIYLFFTIPFFSTFIPWYRKILFQY